MVEKVCFTRPLSFKYTLTKIHQTFFSLHIATPTIPWAYQLSLCNYRTMTAELSCHCQQVIACCRLTVKGFLFERKAHCVSVQVMRLFSYMSNTKVQTTINHCADITPSVVALLQPSPLQREFVPTHDTFFLVFCGTISIVCAVKTIAPLKISRLIGLFQYSRLKVLASPE